MSENYFLIAHLMTLGKKAKGLLGCNRGDFQDFISFIDFLFSKVIGIVGYDYIYPLKPKNPI